MIEVNIYLWIGIIVGLVFSVVYISSLIKRLNQLEEVFVASIDLIGMDIVALDTKQQKDKDQIKMEVDTIRTFLEEKYGNNK